MKIGITGHRELDNPEWVKASITKMLSAGTAITGITSLAKGADQLFAEVVAEQGGNIHAVIPFAGYAEVFDKVSRAKYEELLSKAVVVETLAPATSREMSYFLAGQRVVELSGLLIAVWDGKRAAGLGGTADIVEHAKKNGTPFIQLNPKTRSVIGSDHVGLP